MNSTDVFKQLAINSLLISHELQEQVKQYVFYDKVESETRRKKGEVVSRIKSGLDYSSNPFNGHWGISDDFSDVQLQAVNCSCCGQFHLANGEDASTLHPAIICQCDDDYVTEILSYTTNNRNPDGTVRRDVLITNDDWILRSIIENSNTSNWRIDRNEEEDDEDDEDDDEPFQGLRINYGIDNLLRYF